jgi:steroid delta-isomerase-like uncharacterized protein
MATAHDGCNIGEAEIDRAGWPPRVASSSQRKGGSSMRRIPVLMLLVTLSLIASLRTGSAIHAEDATPASVPPLLQQMMDAANAGDGDAVAALYTADGTHEDVPAGVMARGQEEIATFVTGVVSQFRDARLEPVRSRQSGDLAVLEYTFSGSELQSGQSIAYRGVLIFDLDGDLIRRSVDYYDLAAVLDQLGQLDLPGANAVAEATVAPDATPPAEPIVAAILGSGLPDDAPGKVLQLERITLAPGAIIPTHVHPGTYVIRVDSGTLDFAVVKGAVELTRAGAMDSEPIPAGGEVVVEAGDTIFENGGVVHTAGNPGTTPVVLLTAALLAAGEPDLQLTNDDGTPIPQ